MLIRIINGLAWHEALPGDIFLGRKAQDVERLADVAYHVGDNAEDGAIFLAEDRAFVYDAVVSRGMPLDAQRGLDRVHDRPQQGDGLLGGDGNVRPRGG